MSNWLIAHQMQPCPVSCVATSIAMVAGLPAQDVIDKFHLEYREGDLSIGDMLRHLDIPFKDFRSSDRTSLDRDDVYLCSVPSLNIRGGMHQLVVELNDGEWCVQDPNMNREGRLYYTADASLQEPAVFFSCGYSVDALIDLDDLRAWRELNQAK